MKPNIGRSRWDVVWCVLWSNGVTREKMTAGFVPRIAAAIGDDSGAQVRSRLVVTLMLGLASGLRTFEIVTPDVIDSGSLIATYGALVQNTIDNDEL